MNLTRLLRTAWSGTYAVSGDPAKAECVVGFSFGQLTSDGHIEPGKSNEDIAVVAKSRFPGLPKIFQTEVADAYNRVLPHERIWRIERHRVPKQYLDTREVAEQAQAIMKQNGWSVAALLAHPHHVRRVSEVCDRLGISNIVPPGLDQVHFDPRSSQSWTRNRFKWFLRELPTVIFYGARGWI